MDANSATTPGTSPPCPFVCYEFCDTILPDELQILDHAHVVFCPVSLIQMLYLITRKVPAIKTKLRGLFFKGRTVLDLALPAGNWFVSVRSSATRASVLFPQVCQTNAAIHSAGRDEQSFVQQYHTPYMLHVCLDSNVLKV